MLDFSVIIPLHRDGPQFRGCLERLTALRYDPARYEVIVVTDRVPLAPIQGARVLLTGAERDTSPGVKRDAALQEARGEVCAFIDDDAYPASDWLTRAADAFRAAAPDVAAVGGPGLTPPESSIARRLGGAFYESPLGSGGYRYRFVPGRERYVDDYPAYNLLVKTAALRQVGGYGSTFYGGEDTALCLKLLDAGYRIHYRPDVVVYHHRRPFARAHLRQIGNVGLHRGYFFRAFPATSRRVSYVLPSTLTLLGVALALLGATAPATRQPLLALGLVAYGAMAASAALGGMPPALAAALPLVLSTSHATYGVMFLRGIATRRLAR